MALLIFGQFTLKNFLLDDQCSAAHGKNHSQGREGDAEAVAGIG